MSENDLSPLVLSVAFIFTVKINSRSLNLTIRNVLVVIGTTGNLFHSRIGAITAADYQPFVP